MGYEVENIKKNIKSLRVRKGLTQENTADLLNMSRQNYVRYESNPEDIKIDSLIKMSKIFNCELVEFFLKHNVT